MISSNLSPFFDTSQKFVCQYDFQQVFSHGIKIWNLFEFFLYFYTRNVLSLGGQTVSVGCTVRWKVHSGSQVSLQHIAFRFFGRKLRDSESYISIAHMYSVRVFNPQSGCLSPIRLIFFLIQNLFQFFKWIEPFLSKFYRYSNMYT